MEPHNIRRLTFNKRKKALSSALAPVCVQMNERTLNLHHIGCVPSLQQTHTCLIGVPSVIRFFVIVCIKILTS
jgi:hypothetical protein